MKDKLLYSAVGGCIGAVLTLTLSLFAPLNAQDTPPNAYFGKVTCRELEVISDDKILARLGISKDTHGMSYTTLDMYSPHAREDGKKIELVAANIIGSGITINGLKDEQMLLHFGLIKFFSVEGRLEKVITQDAVFTGAEWFKSILQSPNSSDLSKDAARKEMRRY